MIKILTFLFMIYGTSVLAQTPGAYRVTISPHTRFCPDSVYLVGVAVDSFFVIGTKQQISDVLQRRIRKDMVNANMALTPRSEHWRILYEDGNGKPLTAYQIQSFANIVLPNPDDFLRVYETMKSKEGCSLKGDFCLEVGEDSNMTASFSVECDGLGFSVSTDGELKVKAKKVEVTVK